MRYLVQSSLSGSARPMPQGDGNVFTELSIFPTFELCKKLQEGKKIAAGGPMGATVALRARESGKSARGGGR
jgi:hypothetical protein